MRIHGNSHKEYGLRADVWIILTKMFTAIDGVKKEEKHNRMIQEAISSMHGLTQSPGNGNRKEEKNL